MEIRFPFLWRLAFVLVLSLAFERLALAQPQNAPSVLVPAHPEGTIPSVPYPPTAKGDAAVGLLLTIDDDGTVQSASVTSGDEPFATAARTAALGWRFVPATRDGARI